MCRKCWPECLLLRTLNEFSATEWEAFSQGPWTCCSAWLLQTDAVLQKDQACGSQTQHLCSVSGSSRSNHESKKCIETILRRFSSETSHNASATTQVSFLKKEKSTLKLAEPQRKSLLQIHYAGDELGKYRGLSHLDSDPHSQGEWFVSHVGSVPTFLRTF